MRNAFTLAPGAAWALLLVFLPLLAQWLITSFGLTPWVTYLAALIIGVLVPTIRYLVQLQIPELPSERAIATHGQPVRSKLNRWLF